MRRPPAASGQVQNAARRHDHTGVSIVVCCHNSGPRIERTVEHLAGQQTTRPWEVVLVDNASSDDTVERARQCWTRHAAPTELQVVAEPRPGLSLARDAGLRAARYEYVVFCDDDNWLDPDYIQKAAELLDARPEVGVLGGRNEPVADGPLPPWFANYSQCYAAGVQSIESGDVTGNLHVWGAGMVLRRSVYLLLRRQGVQSLLTDRRGTELCSGGDREICVWFILAGYRLWYEESLRLRHYMSPHRLTTEYCRRLREGNAQSSSMLARYHAVLRARQTRDPRRRTATFLAGLARMCLGKPSGPYSTQAFNPIPGIVFDRDTRRVQQIAERITRSMRAPA